LNHNKELQNETTLKTKQNEKTETVITTTSASFLTNLLSTIHYSFLNFSGCKVKYNLAQHNDFETKKTRKRLRGSFFFCIFAAN